MSDETKKVSEAKGPYRVECPDDEILLTVFPNGRKVDRIGGFSLCDALNEAYENGMASRDGIRDALERAVEHIKQTTGCTCDGLHVCAYTRGRMALEADGGVK